MTNTKEKLSTVKIEQELFITLYREESACLEDIANVNILLEREFNKMRREKLLEIASRSLNEFFIKIDLPFQEIRALSCIYHPMTGERKTDEELIEETYKSNPEKRHFTVADLHNILNAKNHIFGNRIVIDIQVFLKMTGEHIVKYLQTIYPNVSEKRLIQVAKKLLNGKILQEYDIYKKILGSIK